MDELNWTRRLLAKEDNSRTINSSAAPIAMRRSFAAPASGTRRTQLQRYDLSTPGRELIQVRIDFGPEYVAPRHVHPGEEVVYVLEGTLEYTVDGRPPLTVKAGDVLTIPAGTPHSVKNLGKTNGAELATYIVEKGKPLVLLVK